MPLPADLHSLSLLDVSGLIGSRALPVGLAKIGMPIGPLLSEAGLLRRRMPSCRRPTGT